MSISFIITTFNIEPYIGQCLESLVPCLRPGDQVILVDDGSTDGTEAVINAFIAQGGLPDGVHWTPIWLGTNTVGGVGIPGNIGLDHVRCDTVFFVDGDDYMVPAEFHRVRKEYEARPTDIWFTDYLEFDQASGRTKLPSDARRWDTIRQGVAGPEVRLAAIGLIAVPWRKFYRTAFLRQHAIRFPEGDFFFEDNPFHWRVCVAARTIGFSRRVVCHHRVNRPGQTMASTGRELTAFFTHFQTICDDIARTGAGDQADELYPQAIRWLVGNMSWHIPRLAQAAFYSYASHASAALRKIPEADWLAVAPEMSDSATWQQADRLRQDGGVWDVVEAWRTHAYRRRVEHDLKGLGQSLKRVEAQVKSNLAVLHAQRAIDEFNVMRTLSEQAGNGAPPAGS